MPLSSRELYLVLRAKNEAGAQIRSLGKDFDKARESAELMGLKARQAQLGAEQATQRAAKAQQDYTLRQLESQRAVEQQAAATARSRIATSDYATSMVQAQQAVERQTESTARNRVAVDQNAVAMLQNAKAQNTLNIERLRSVPGNDQAIRGLREQNQVLQQQIITTRNNIVANQDAMNTSRQQIAVYQQQINAGKELSQNEKAALLNAQDRVRAYDSQINSQRDVVSGMRNEISQRQELIAATGREIAATKEANDQRRIAADRLRDTGSAMASAGTGMVVGGTAVLAGVYQLTQAAVDYEKQTAMTKTQVRETGVTLEQLGKIGLDVARDFGVGFDQIQDALFDIFSSTDATVPQATTLLREFAKAAVAGSVDIKTAGTTTIGVLNAWHRPITDTTEILDTQFKVVQLGRITYEELNRTVGRSIPSAVHAGQSFEELGGIIAFLTRSGLSAANSVTSAGRALDLFSNPAVVGRLKEMGINARDASGNFRPLSDVVVELQAKLGKLDPAKRAEEINALFKGSGNNIQARRFWDLVLASDKGAKSFKDMVDQVKDSGGALESAYGTMSDTLAVRNEKMKNQWKVLAITLGEDLFPAIENISNKLSALGDWFNKLSPGQQSFLAWAVVIGGLLTVAAGVIFVFAGAIASLIAIVGGAVVAIGALVLIIGGAFIAAWIYAYNKVEWFHDAVNAYIHAIGATMEWLWHAAQAVWDSIVNLLQAAWRDIQTIWDALKSAVHSLGDAWDWLKNAASTVWNGIKDVVKSVTDWLVQTWNSVSGAVTSFGRSFLDLLENFFRPAWNAMKLIMDIWWAGVQVTWGLIQIAIKILGAAFSWLYDNVVKPVWDGIKNAISSAWDFIKNIWDTCISFIKGQFAQAWNWLHDNVIKPVWDKIQQLLKAAWDWINSNVFTPIMNFIKGPLTDAWNWLRDKIVDSWNFWTDKIKAGWDWVKTNVFNPISDAITKTLPNAFDAGVRAIGSAWDKVQEIVRKPIAFVVNQILDDGLLAGYNHIAKTFNVKPDDVQIKRMATGGAAIGAGGPTEDKIPAMLSNGEHVWTASEVQKAGGHQAMYRMRELVSKGRAKFAGGGSVGGYPSHARGDGPFDWITGLVGAIAPGAAPALGALASDPGAVLGKFVGKLTEAGPGQAAAVAIAAGTKVIEGVIKWIGEKIGFGSGDAGTGKFQAQPNGWPPHLGNAPPWSPNVEAAANFIKGMNPGMAVGSYQSPYAWSDHFPKAIDNMNNAAIPSQLNRGNGLAKWFIEHPAQFGTKYVIWNKRITTGDGWGPYSVPGQGDHSDHVHLSFYKKGGAAARQIMDQGGLLRPGVTSVLNGTAAAERVLTTQQTQSFEQLVTMLDADRARTQMSGLAPTGGYGGRGGNTFVVNVYTQEIDPRRHAMMLGTELEKAMG